uniref:Uncharacterized protein n=1 Tax=Opuntia streptacantha TaxID=393608 RepID=A0A7C9AY83_OPUST
MELEQVWGRYWSIQLPRSRVGQGGEKDQRVQALLQDRGGVSACQRRRMGPEIRSPWNGACRRVCCLPPPSRFTSVDDIQIRPYPHRPQLTDIRALQLRANQENGKKRCAIRAYWADKHVKQWRNGPRARVRRLGC